MDRIVINGRFLSQPLTGVQRYAIELVTQWDRWLDQGTIDCDRVAWELLTPPDARSLPLKHIPQRTIGRWSGHCWEQLELPFHASDAMLFCPCNTAPIVSLLNRRAVVTVHDVSYYQFPRAFSLAFRSFYMLMTPVIARRAEAVLTDSDSEAAEIVKRFPHVRERLHVVRLGGAAKHLMSGRNSDAQTKERRSKRFVLYVGSMCERKNVSGVIDAARVLLKSHPDVSVVLCGGAARAFASAKKSASLPSNVVMAGRVSDVELQRLYEEAACFVFPSFHEGSGLPPIEAMANGCPVVASDIAVHREHLGDAAVYCDPYRTEDIAGNIATVLEDDALANSLRRKGPQKAGEYSWEKCAGETLQVLGNVMGLADWTAQRSREAA